MNSRYNLLRVLTKQMRGCLLLVSLLLSVMAMAQKTCVIASAEDHVPVREALIHTNNNHWARTDYRGYWTMKYQFDSATVSKPGFLKTTIYLKNLPDTVFLLPHSHQLTEVEVWGENMPGIKGIEGEARKQAEIGGAGVSTGASFDLAKMLDKRGRRDSKHLREAHKIFSEMGRVDPIEAAYEKATGKKYSVNDSLKSSVKPITPTEEKPKDADSPRNQAIDKRKDSDKDTPPTDEEKSTKRVRVSIEESVAIRK